MELGPLLPQGPEMLVVLALPVVLMAVLFVIAYFVIRSAVRGGVRDGLRDWDARRPHEDSLR